MLKKIIWIAVSLITAVSLSIVVGIINPTEKVNALWIMAVLALIVLADILYKWYGIFFKKVRV